MTSARLLIVEDEAIVARDLRSRLQRLGYAVEATTGQGEEAIALAEQLVPDLVLMDICLQGQVDGIAAAEAIRTRLMVPVVYLTAHADEATLARARITEPYGYILKPFEERELRTAIEIALYKHKADRRVRASERRFATTLASIGDGVIATDAEGRITFMNSVAEKATGWPLVDAQNRPLTEVFRIVNEETHAPVANPVERVLREGVVVGLANHTVLLHRQGAESPIDDCAAPIHDDAGVATGAVLVFRDVSESRRLEEQLRHAQKMEGIGNLAGGIAHDFNNLLTAILGYVEVLLGSVDDAHPWAGPLGEIRRAGERAAELTRQLLLFSRKQLLQPKVLDLNVVVAGTEKLLRRLLGPGIEVKTLLDPNLGPIKADPGQLEQVLVNLAVNARDAMPDGGQLMVETCDVRFGPGSDEPPAGLASGTYRRLRVSDTGCGMTSAVKARIFEPFFTTKEVGKGTGLGLATVYSIVMQQCGGHIQVESEVGRGSTFTLYFPPCEGTRSITEEPALPVRNLPRGTETVLLVDDERAVRSLARHILAGCGYTILEAENGVRAIETAGNYTGRIDVLVTDLIMPRMGGRALIGLLEQDRPGIKVLCISGHSDQPMSDFDQRGVPMAFLSKPFTMEGLATAVRSLLDR